jgi:hemin uptake protein HemP
MPGDDHGVRRQLGAALRSVRGLPRDSGQPVRSFDTTELFGTDTEIEITHQHTVYRLKITRQGKLILNK